DAQRRERGWAEETCGRGEAGVEGGPGARGSDVLASQQVEAWRARGRRLGRASARPSGVARASDRVAGNAVPAAPNGLWIPRVQNAVRVASGRTTPSLNRDAPARNDSAKTAQQAQTEAPPMSADLDGIDPDWLPPPYTGKSHCKTN